MTPTEQAAWRASAADAVAYALGGEFVQAERVLALLDYVQALEAREAGLLMALVRHGQHEDGCAIDKHAADGGGTCDCGLDAALTPPTPEETR